MQKWPKWALLAYSIRVHSNSICEHLVSPFMAMRLFLQVHINFCAHLHTHLIPTHVPLQLQLKEQVKSWANFNHNKFCRVIKKKKIYEKLSVFFFFYFHIISRRNWSAWWTSNYCPHGFDFVLGCRTMGTSVIGLLELSEFKTAAFNCMWAWQSISLHKSGVYSKINK